MPMMLFTRALLARVELLNVSEKPFGFKDIKKPNVFHYPVQAKNLRMLTLNKSKNKH